MSAQHGPRGLASSSAPLGLRAAAILVSLFAVALVVAQLRLVSQSPPDGFTLLWLYGAKIGALSLRQLARIGLKLVGLALIVVYALGSLVEARKGDFGGVLWGGVAVFVIIIVLTAVYSLLG